MLSYFLHELKSRRGAMLGWSLGMTFFVLLYVGLYPSFNEQLPDFSGLLDLPIYQALGISTMSTYEGWLSSTVLNFMPVIIGVFAITAGTAALVGEEERGTLENIAALPLARWQIVTSKYLAILLALLSVLAITGLVTLGVTAWVKTQIEVGLNYRSISIAIAAAFPLLASLAAISLFFGAFLPTRSVANGFGLVVLIAGYLTSNLFEQMETLRDFVALSPFHYYNASESAFTEGILWGDNLTLIVLTLAFFGLALLSFQRRDLMVPRWFWDRQRLDR